jgi:hypothetical protein
LYAKVPQQLEVTLKPPGKLTIECDEVDAVVSRRFPAGEFAASLLSIAKVISNGFG